MENNGINNGSKKLSPVSFFAKLLAENGLFISDSLLQEAKKYEADILLSIYSDADWEGPSINPNDKGKKYLCDRFGVNYLSADD